MRLLYSSGIDYTCMLHSSLKVECNETIFSEQSVFFVRNITETIYRYC